METTGNHTPVQKPIAISMGDPSGIGPDIIINCWNNRSANKLPSFLVVGDKNLLEQRAKAMGINVRFALLPHEFTEIDLSLHQEQLPVMQTHSAMTGNPGRPDIKDAAGTMEAIETCVNLVLNGTCSGMVTCPITKKVLYEAGFKHPGHTEYLAELASSHPGHSGKTVHPVMMIAGPLLKAIPVTIHIPVADITDMLTTELIVKTAEITARDLTQKFGIKNPRLAIAGLNPHAGEAGSIGLEDQKIVEPAVKELKNTGHDVMGPLPADTMFHDAARAQYDVALCMYHDQALIPAKTLGFDDGVNVTLGLPFIRTSPDHGTAYDIAGTGKASPASFIAALKMANEMSRHETAQS